MSAIDPGIDDQLKEGAQDVDDNANDDKANEEEQEEEDYLEPSRWWFASTASPLLAGTLGPIASAFSICALVYKWRLFIPPNGSPQYGVSIADPKWLIVVNALSLPFALIGNASLLLNMAKRLKFSVAQPITIIGFFVASILLIADMAALTASPTYHIDDPAQRPAYAHALSSAFYYALFASILYMFVGLVMCVTVYGAYKGYYPRDFNLTASQRSLMLQTMSFVAYLLLGALVYSKIEDWDYLDSVYWVDVTLLTVGFGDFAPATDLGRGLLFPFAIGGILMVGLVIGSIRTLVLERGSEKLAARITEKRRSTAVHNVDERKQTIRISWFASAEFSTDPSMSAAQRREAEFLVMRKVQAAAESERLWTGLIISATFAAILWFVGAVVFMFCEKDQQWSYFDSLYFTYVCLLTIGYGDLAPNSNSGRAFFVIWSLLAVPSLTILISNMGDTVVKWFSDLTVWVGSITVLPGEQSFKATTKPFAQRIIHSVRNAISRFAPPGILGDAPQHDDQLESVTTEKEHNDEMLDNLAQRLERHIEREEIDAARQAENEGDNLTRDIHFYHFVLSRECRNLQRDVGVSPPKQYSWQEWEYYLKLMGDNQDKDSQTLVPPVLQPALSATEETTSESYRTAENDSDATSNQPASQAGSQNMDGIVDRETERREYREAHERNEKRRRSGKKRRPTIYDLKDWSWLSSQSPLMGTKSESEWILDRLSSALERELNRQRKGVKIKPPVGMADMKRTIKAPLFKQRENGGGA